MTLTMSDTLLFYFNFYKTSLDVYIRFKDITNEKLWAVFKIHIMRNVRAKIFTYFKFKVRTPRSDVFFLIIMKKHLLKSDTKR